MREHSVMPHLVDFTIRQLQAGCKLPNLVAQVRKTDDLIGSEKMLDSIGKMLRNVSSVISKSFRRISRLPASRQRLRQIPVKQRDVGRNLVLKQFVHQALIIGKAFLVRLACS